MAKNIILDSVSKKFIEVDKPSDLVLSRYRDPWTPWTDIHRERAEWIAYWFQKMGREIHERGYHYWLQSLGEAIKPDGIPYLNTDDDWSLLMTWIKWAKYLQVGDWRNLIDRKHPEPMIYLGDNNIKPGFLVKSKTNKSPQEVVDYRLQELVDDIILELLEDTPQYETGGFQNYLLVVFCEKNSMNHFIAPVVRQFEGVFQPLAGETSLERVEEVIRKAKQIGKAVRVFYISDFDPAGEHMPTSTARKFEWFARVKYSLPFEVKLKPLALTKEQVVHYALPGVPTKEGDSKAKRFIEKYGDRATELDALEALHPGELAEIIRQALKPYYDYKNPGILSRENSRILKKADEIVEGIRPKLEEALSDLRVEGLEQIDLQLAVNKEFQVPKANHYIDDNNGWLLDTSRSYEKQLVVYDEWKGE